MSGIFIQQLQGQKTDDTQFGIPKLHAKYQPPKFLEFFEDDENCFLLEFWEMLDNNWLTAIDVQWKYRTAIYVAATRAAQNEYAPEDVKKLAESLKWRLNQWDVKQRSMWQYIMNLGHEKLLEANPPLKEHIKNQDKEQVPEFMKDWPK
jgi:hypothetical protein